jgi:hypothetical protein
MAHPQPQACSLLWGGIVTKFDAGEDEDIGERKSSLLQILQVSTMPIYNLMVTLAIIQLPLPRPTSWPSA